ncbi:hypothetical protein TRAPUB_7048 [Trametes pubescens]|uniref:Uncharacterized protein n=1 Tax=Trametes pubescens TaxID=154538 RepID=A0A1M2V464_TRAPU|nr:hypothetical protein TRAPUB_7048 [Trametes pubescens]
MPHLPQTTLGPDPEQCDRFADSLSSAAATEAVVQDIERLQKNIDVINDLFDKVARPLLKFDIQYFGRADHTSALSPQWNVFPKRFNAYVDNSRDSAAAASRIMHLYATTVLDRVKDMNCNVTSLVKEIEHFKEKVQKHIVVAKTVRGNFSEIAADIKEFKEIVQITIDLESITGPLSEDITKAVGNIQLLEQKVSK